MLFWQILIDGFAISSLYALGATGFTLIFGVTGVLNLSHGAIMVAAAVAAWAASGNFGAGGLSRRPIRRHRRAPALARHLLSHRQAAAIVARGARGGEGNLHPHRDAA